MAIEYTNTPNGSSREAMRYLFSSIAAGSSVLKIKESTSDATVNIPPTIPQNLENNQTQVIPTHHMTHVVKKCANGLCFSVCTTLIGDTSTPINSPGWA